MTLEFTAHKLLMLLGHFALELLADLVHAAKVVHLLGAPHRILHHHLAQAMLHEVKHEVLHVDLFL